ncbi:MAG: hypothetical protein IJJ15_05415 [Ruminococcus sp.]|nr:hypothetical protein [Ruminococcus sp.]
MKRYVGKSFVILVAIITLLTFAIPAAAAGYYIHDPMDNPKAAADIVVDPNAVYGYAPNPESTRLAPYAQYDWSDKEFVAEMRQQREEYHESLKELYQIKADMEAEGKSIEDIARAVSTRRNEIRMEAYKDDPEGLEKLKESNLATFGNENGGTPDYFYQKYGSWETVIEKSFSTNEGADAILGLYDKYYDTYIIDNDPSGNRNATDTTEATEATIATEATTATQPSETAAVTYIKSPDTGDHSIILLWIIGAMSGVVIICAATLVSKKKQ